MRREPRVSRALLEVLAPQEPQVYRVHLEAPELLVLLEVLAPQELPVLLETLEPVPQVALAPLEVLGPVPRVEPVHLVQLDPQEVLVQREERVRLVLQEVVEVRV